MDERSQGVILRASALTESSLIVRWITRDHGRISTVAKGARRPKSVFAGKLDLYFLADFSFQRSRRSDLHTLREVMPKDTHPQLRKNIAWLQQAAYAGALLELATEPESPVPDVYDLWMNFLKQLPLQPPEPLMIIGWEMKLLELCGLRPDLEKAPLTAGVRQILVQCSSAEWSFMHRMKLSPAQTREIQSYLQDAIQSGFGRIPGQRDAALAASFE